MAAPDHGERLATLEAQMKAVALDFSQLREELRRRGASAAIWVGILVSTVSAVAAIWLAVETARAQPDPQALAHAVAAELDARHR